MRHTSELLKVVAEPERAEEPSRKRETKELNLIAATNRETKEHKVINDNHALEAHNFTHLHAQLQPLMRPVRQAEISPSRLDPHLVTFQDFDPAAAAQYNRLAIALITAAMKKPPLKRILLASAHHCEGRTCVTLNLAAALSRAKRRVLVIDSDLMRPSVSRLLGVDSDVGLAEALADGLKPETAVTRLLPVSFDILPTRAQIENAAELLASPDFRTMLAALDAGYDFILFDSAPLLASADASLIVLHTHATLLVVRPGTTTSSQMAKAVSLLSEDRLFGVVLNRVES